MKQNFVMAIGYNVLAVDIRGTGSSPSTDSGDWREGTWVSFDLAEHHDTAYVVDHWIPRQGWSDGTVGMVGPSYMGIIQLLTAGLAQRDEGGTPTHLKAILPSVTMSDPYHDIVFHGGNVDLEFIPVWLLGVDLLAMLPPLLYLGEDGPPDLATLEEATSLWLNHLQQLPIHIGWIMDYTNSMDGPFYERKSPMIYWPYPYKDDPDDSYSGGWCATDTDAGIIEGSSSIPSGMGVFLVGGWFDIFTPGTLNNYTYGLSQHTPSDKALVMGPWYHLGGAIALGLNDMFMSQEIPARWFDWKLKGQEDCFLEQFPVLLFVMGAERWRAERSWPLAETRVRETTLHLTKSPAEIITDDWFASLNAPLNYRLTHETPSVFDLAGDDPVLVHAPPFFHGLTSRSAVRWLMGVPGLLGQVSKYLLGQNIDPLTPGEDERADELGCLTFTTPALEEDFEITGPLTLTFWAKTSFSPVTTPILEGTREVIKGIFDIDTNMLLDLMIQKDVQWVSELNDVFPDGRARNITSGWLSASHRPYRRDAQGNEAQSAEGEHEHPLDADYVPHDPFHDYSHNQPQQEIVPGDLYQYAVELWPTCNVFKAGHRIRVSLSASDFPHLLPVMVPSRNTIVIDADHPATLTFDRVRDDVGENETWMYLEDANAYLLTHTDEPVDTEESAPEEAARERAEDTPSAGTAALAADGDDSRCFIGVAGARGR